MPVVVKCGQCGARYQVGDQLLGKQIQCQACKTSIRVSASTAPQAPAQNAAAGLALPKISLDLPPELGPSPASAAARPAAPIAVASPVAPTAAIRTAAIPTATIPTANIPSVSIPTASIPSASLPSAALPTAAIPAAAPQPTPDLGDPFGLGSSSASLNMPLQPFPADPFAPTSQPVAPVLATVPDPLQLTPLGQIPLPAARPLQQHSLRSKKPEPTQLPMLLIGSVLFGGVGGVAAIVALVLFLGSGSSDPEEPISSRIVAQHETANPATARPSAIVTPIAPLPASVTSKPTRVAAVPTKTNWETGVVRGTPAANPPAANVPPTTPATNKPERSQTAHETPDEEQLPPIDWKAFFTPPGEDAVVRRAPDAPPPTKAAQWRAKAEELPPDPTFAKDWTLNIPLRRESEFVHPNSYFVLDFEVKNNEGQFTLWDLTTGEISGELNVPGVDTFAEATVSLDGKLLTTITKRQQENEPAMDADEDAGDKEEVDKEKPVEKPADKPGLTLGRPRPNLAARPRAPDHLDKEAAVYSFATKQRVQGIAVPWTIRTARYSSKQSLLLSDSPFEPLQVWDAVNAKPLRLLKVDRNASGEFLLSPGGRYIVLHENDLITLVDTEKANLAGEIRGFGARVKGLAFSLDGKELAALLDNNRLIAWSMDNGRQLVDHDLTVALEDRTGFGSGGDLPLSYLPGRIGWLVFGATIIDRLSGEAIWAGSEKPGSRQQPVRVLPNGHLLVSNGEGFRNTLTTIELPGQQLQKAQTLVRAGGRLIDATLPPLTLTNLNTAPKIPEPREAPKAPLAPDPAAQPQHQLAADPIELARGDEQVGQVLFSAPTAGRAVVAYGQVDRSPFGRKVTGKPVLVERFDLVQAEHINSLNLPEGSRLLSLSPDGNRVLASIGHGDDRLDVYDLETDQHIAGWRPFREERGNNGERRFAFQPNAGTPQRVAGAVMVDSHHVLTLNQGGKKLALWKLPECQPVYVKSNTVVQAAALSPGHHQLAILTGGSIRILDPLTGQTTGAIRFLDSVGDVQFKFHPAGAQLAILAQDKLYICDLASGSVTEGIDLPISAKQFQWCDGSYLMLDHYLYDIRRRAIVWHYGTENQSFELNTDRVPDTRYWYTARDPSGRQTLVAAQLPEPQALAKIDEKVPPEFRAVVSPGAAVRLDLTLGGGDIEPARKALGTQLASLGYKPAEGEPPVGTFKVQTQQLSQRTIEYRNFGSSPLNPGPTTSVTVTRIRLDFTLEDPMGKRIWGRRTEVGGSASHFYHGDPTEQTNDHWKQAASFLTYVQLPQVFYAQPFHGPDFTLGIGTSALSVNGPRPAPPPNTSPTTSATGGF